MSDCKPWNSDGAWLWRGSDSQKRNFQRGQTVGLHYYILGKRENWGNKQQLQYSVCAFLKYFLLFFNTWSNHKRSLEYNFCFLAGLTLNPEQVLFCLTLFMKDDLPGKPNTNKWWPLHSRLFLPFFSFFFHLNLLDSKFYFILFALFKVFSHFSLYFGNTMSDLACV